MNKNAVRRVAGGEEDATSRRQAILELVGERSIGNQAELARLLARRGLHATQATLSRDLKALGVGKLPVNGETVYVLPAPPREILDRRTQLLEIEALVRSVRPVGNLVVVRTPPGNAHGVARAIDLQEWDEVAGTLAGDDTILVITESPQAAQRFRRQLGEIAGRNFA